MRRSRVVTLCALALWLLSCRITSAQTLLTTIPVNAGLSSSPHGIVLNPVTNKVYVASPVNDNVTVIDGSNNTVTATVAVPTSVQYLAINTVTNKIYAPNGGGMGQGYISVIDGSNNSVTNVPFSDPSGPGQIALNEVTNRLYVLAYQTMTVIDGSNNTVVG